MKIQKIIGIYILTLGLTAFLNMQFPSKIISLIHFFLPLQVDINSQNFIRYRMALFLIATITFLILSPIIWRFGFYGTNIEKIRKAHWRHFIVAIFVLPIGWVGYPFLALCTTCWTANDVFYFILTISFFISLHIFLQSLILKITQK